MAISIADARRVKPGLAAEVRDRAPVAGIGLTKVDDSYALRVNLSAEFDHSTLPQEFDGVPVVYKVVGALRKVLAG